MIGDLLNEEYHIGNMNIEPTTDNYDWQMRGLCRGEDSAKFYHPDGERGRARALREAMAKEICKHCPVLQECRNHALENREEYGIWGGMGEKEREILFRKSRRQAS